MTRFFDLYLLDRVIAAGSFTAASRQVGLSKSRISRRLAALEERLGVRLIQRDSRKMMPTPLGRTVAAHARAMVSQADAAEMVARESAAEPSGLLRISAPTVLCDLFVGKLVADFAASHPKLHVEMEHSWRFADLIAEEIDVAIRVSSAPLPNSQLVVRKLSIIPMALVASPAWLDGIGRPQDLADLAGAPCLMQGTAESVEQWSFVGPAGEKCASAARARFVVDSDVALLEGALAGLGIARLPRYLCAAELAAGRLETVLPQWRTGPRTVYIAYPARQNLSQAARRFVDYLSGRMPPAIVDSRLVNAASPKRSTSR